MFSLNYADKRPLYRQIEDRFRELILTGVMAEGDKVPSVRELAASLAINPNTIQKAYKELEADGYLLSVPAKGSFVAPMKNRDNRPRLEELRAQLRAAVREMRCMGEKKAAVLAEIENVYKEEGL